MTRPHRSAFSPTFPCFPPLCRSAVPPSPDIPQICITLIISVICKALVTERTYYTFLAYVLLHVSYQEFMHGNLLSCINRIKHEDVNYSSRFQLPRHQPPSPDGPLAPVRLDGPRHGIQCLRPDHHHLPHHHYHLVQHAPDAGEYRLRHRDDPLPVVFQRHTDV